MIESLFLAQSLWCHLRPSMAAPAPQGRPGPSGRESSAAPHPPAPHRPTEALWNTQSTTDMYPHAPGKKRRNHRGGKKKKNRRQSFLPGAQEGSMDPPRSSHGMDEPQSSSATRPTMYRLGQSGGRNLSETSLDSTALLDHR